MDARFGNGWKLPTRAVTSREPLRIRLADEQDAIALGAALDELGKVEISDRTGTWEVALYGSKADRVVVKVLDAVRRTLAGDPSASAEVLLDGREYLMHGE